MKGKKRDGKETEKFASTSLLHIISGPILPLRALLTEEVKAEVMELKQLTQQA